MTKSNAQRQADYRRRHLKDVDGELERLNMLVHVSAKRKLERLAICYGVTQRTLLESIVQDEENRVLSGMTVEDRASYYVLPHHKLKPQDPAFQTIRIQDLIEKPVQETATPSTEITENLTIQDAPAAAPIKYKGVYPHKASGKWQAQCRENGKSKSLGLFPTPEEANTARLAYLSKRNGK